eukprot:m.271886 g.271886  ORF g.271886 m.271886 type:complete len:85 (+) comp16270_c0_seq10:723-977(+)
MGSYRLLWTCVKLLTSMHFRLPSANPLNLQDLGYSGEPVQTSPKAVLDFKGGETAALKRLKSWIWEKDCLRNYKETRNGLLGVQ